MSWRQFSMDLDGLPLAPVEAAFFRHGALAVTFSNAGAEPVLEPAPGDMPLWRDTRIIGLFQATAELDVLQLALLAEFGLDRLPGHAMETLADRDWEREWLKDFRPMRFGKRLWVGPSHREPPHGDAVAVRLDPGLAFGTGTHATTALCLEWLDTLDLAQASVLDFGSGSGILSIAALLLGAGSATAVDIDPQALTATRENAAKNGVADRLVGVPALEASDGPYDIVVANVLAGPLIEQARVLCRRLRPGGRLALSGIMEKQLQRVADAYRAWIDFDPPAARDGWLRLSGTRNSTSADVHTVP